MDKKQITSITFAYISKSFDSLDKSAYIKTQEIWHQGNQYTSVNDIWNDFKNAMWVIITDLVPSKISRKDHQTHGWQPTSNIYYVDDKKHFPEPDTKTRQKIGPDRNS